MNVLHQPKWIRDGLWVLGSGALLAISMGLVGLHRSSDQARRAALEEEVRIKRTLLRDARENEAKGDQLAVLEALEEHWADTREDGPDQIATFSRCSADSGARLSALRGTGASSEDTSPAVATSHFVAVYGDFAQIIAFLQLLQEADGLVGIFDLHIQRGSSDTLEASMKVSWFASSKGSPENGEAQ